MIIDIGESLDITVKMGSEEYKLREPTVDDIEKLSGHDSTNHKEANRALQQFIVDLGMPEDVVKSIGVMRLQKLAEGLTSSFTEKK